MFSLGDVDNNRGMLILLSSDTDRDKAGVLMLTKRERRGRKYRDTVLMLTGIYFVYKVLVLHVLKHILICLYGISYIYQRSK